MKLHKWMVGAVAGAAMLVAGVASAQEKVTVWFEKGFYKAEDDALFSLIKKFEDKFKIKVDLSLYGTQEIIPKSVAAMDAGSPPDVAFGNVFDFQATGKWAFDGKLEDLSSVINPIANRFEPAALSTTFLLNGKTGTRSYFAFPVKQQTMHIQYWKDMLAEAGFKESDIPKDWKGYWSFWCEKVQVGYRKNTGKRGFGTGFPMGVDSSDSFYSFLTFVDAYNVKLVSDAGKLLVDDPAVRQGLINALNDYTYVYREGCTPPSATNWKDPDNNVAFHNKTTVMTHNATISIAAKWLDDMNNAALTPEQRATAKTNYTEKIATAGFPNKPDGSKMTYRAAVKTGVIFAEAKNKAAGKKFVSFLLEDANLTPYVEGSLGRWYPVTKSGQQRPFWKADPHRAAVHAQFQAGTTPFEFTKNYHFTVVNKENVWAKAMNRVLSDKVSPEQAVDEMISRIKTIASN